MGAFVVNWMQMNIRGDRMKRLLLLLACLLALCTGVCAAEPVISEMKTDCTLTGSSSCQVTQSFTLEISGAQTQLRFPLSAGAKKASVAGYQTQKQTDGDCPVLVLTDANGFTGTRSFTVMYTISGLASEADGVQTLSLPLMSAKWDYPISKYVFTVTLPKPFESYPAFTSGYHGDVISDYIDLDVSESRITGVIETGLKDHESLEMTLTLDKSYFPARIPRFRSAGPARQSFCCCSRWRSFTGSRLCAVHGCAYPHGCCRRMRRCRATCRSCWRADRSSSICWSATGQVWDI